jgi:hypothetical protein
VRPSRPGRLRSAGRTPTPNATKDSITNRIRRGGSGRSWPNRD